MNSRKDRAAAGVYSAAGQPKIAKVPTMLSLASSPVRQATTARQSPQPARENRGARADPSAANRLWSRAPEDR